MKAIVTMLSVLFVVPALANPPRVLLDTDQGPIILELDPQRAPNTVNNFLSYVDDGFFDGLVFHRVIRDFVIQSGAFTRDLVFRPPTRPAIASERGNGLSNTPGTIAMALAGSNVNSAQTQFYINTVSNTPLDTNFTVFGRVVFGMEAVRRIEQLPTGSPLVNGVVFADTPVQLPAIRRAVRIEGSGFPILPQHAGSWFDPQRPGVGFNIEITTAPTPAAEPILLVYWYDFRDGQKLWMAGNVGFQPGKTAIEVPLIHAPPPNPQAGFLSPPPFEQYEVWGTLTLRFDDCSRGRFSYQAALEGSGTIDVERLTAPAATRCD